MRLGRMLRLIERPTPEPAHLEIAHDGEVHRIALKRSARSRRFTLRVRTASRDVLLTMPARAPLKAAREFAERHSAWIGVRLARLPRLVAFEPEEAAPLRGVDHTIVHRPGARGVVWLERGAAGRSSASPASGRMCRAASPISSSARRAGTSRPRFSATPGRSEFRPRNIAVRDTVSRWGSCSSGGRLSFSWRLILAPPFVLDYLAAHEVAHLVHLNHSVRFWSLLRRVCPDTDRAEAWLKAHGPSLHRFGAGAA